METKERKRILWTGAAPWCNGSYGKPLRYVIPRFHAAGYDSAIACFYGFRGGVADMPLADGTPVRLYPLVRDKYLNDIIQFHAKDFEADVVISFQDVWPLVGWGYPRDLVWMPWMPVDCAPVTPEIIKAIEGAYAPVSYSEWGRAQLEAAGYPTARHIPLGVDLDVCRPKDRDECRARLGLPKGEFIAGMVAANASYPSRKSFPEVILAWRKWKDAGHAGRLYLHTTVTPRHEQGIPMQAILDEQGLRWATLDDPEPSHIEQADVLFPCQYRMWCHAVDDDELTDVYNALDVLLSPSMGEGFGLPILEAQACGVPVVTVNWTGMADITFAGLCLEPAQMMWDNQQSWRAIADVDAIVGALEWAKIFTADPMERTRLANRAREGASQFQWADIVRDHWLPLLAEVVG